MGEPETLGARFATALSTKDFATVRELLHPEVDFRGMTPSRFWEASDPDTLISEVLEQWFEPSDDIRSLDSLETDGFADRERTGWRFRVTNPDGDFVVEQQAYVGVSDGQIAWMRVMCSGFRPVE